MKDALPDQEKDKGIIKAISSDTYGTMKYSAMQNAKIKEGPLVVNGERARSIGSLFTATERYREQMGELDRRCLSQTVYTEGIYHELASVNDAMLQNCAQFEKEVDDKFVIKAAQAEFGERMAHILSKSYCINRCRTWPQGYQEDYKTLEAIYRNSPMSQGIGYYLDKYLLSSTLAVAVRERMSALLELLRNELMNGHKPKVLDVACGSCREISELAPEIITSGARFTCIDADADALKFALNRLSYTGLSSDRVEFVKYNALRMFDDETARAEFGMQDIIYSVGFFDYLPNDFLEKLLRTLFKLLNPGGKLIASFKDANRHKAQAFHWLTGWDVFFQRAEDDFERILREAGIPHSALSVSRDRTGAILFHTITKPQDRTDRGLPLIRRITPGESFKFSRDKMKNWQLSPAAHLQTLNVEQITESISQRAPYLLLNSASTLLLEDGRQCIVAETNFPAQICEGHYPGAPTVPLVDMGRAMDQAAALFASQSSDARPGIPLLLGIDRLRAGNVSFCPADVHCVIVAERPASQIDTRKINTRMYLVSSNDLIATMDGWKYEFGFPKIASSDSPFKSSAILEKYHPCNKCIDIGLEQIFDLIPQRPPFLVISKATFGMAHDGAPVLHSFASFPDSAVNGHFCDCSVIGPMHNSRCLAQSGMLLSSLVAGTSTGIPEVVQTKTIRCETARYFPSCTTIETFVRCEKVSARGNLTLISVSGVVFIREYQAADTDEFKYVMVPREKHPSANSGMNFT